MLCLHVSVCDKPTVTRALRLLPCVRHVSNKPVGGECTALLCGRTTNQLCTAWSALCCSKVFENHEVKEACILSSTSTWRRARWIWYNVSRCNIQEEKEKAQMVGPCHHFPVPTQSMIQWRYRTPCGLILLSVAFCKSASHALELQSSVGLLYLRLGPHFQSSRITRGGDSPAVPILYPCVQWRMHPSNEIHGMELLPREIAVRSIFWTVRRHCCWNDRGHFFWTQTYS